MRIPPSIAISHHHHRTHISILSYLLFNITFIHLELSFFIIIPNIEFPCNWNVITWIGTLLLSVYIDGKAFALHFFSSFNDFKCKVVRNETNEAVKKEEKNCFLYCCWGKKIEYFILSFLYFLTDMTWHRRERENNTEKITHSKCLEVKEELFFYDIHHQWRPWLIDIYKV